MSTKSQPCPECGMWSEQDGHMITVHYPDKWAMVLGCDTCEKRDKQRALDAGRRIGEMHAKRIDEAIFKAIEKLDKESLNAL